VLVQGEMILTACHEASAILLGFFYKLPREPMGAQIKLLPRATQAVNVKASEVDSPLLLILMLLLFLTVIQTLIIARTANLRR
jgi:hypothetical protein